jgi:transketolase
MRDTFVKALLDEAMQDKNIILVTGDLGFGVLDEFERNLPSQFINAGVAEQAMLGMAAGIAATGKRVFVYSIANFPTIRALEQIRNDICYMNNPVVIVAVGSGYSYGSQGYTHHALEDIAVMRAMPNMNVISPADPIETEILTRLLAKDKRPAYLRLGRSNEKNLNQGIPQLVQGRFNRIHDGKHGTILFTGAIGDNVMEARDLLSSHGIDVSVYSVPFISKISERDLQSIDRNNPTLVVEEHSIRGGLSSAILEAISTYRIELQIIPIAASQHQLNNIGSQKFLRDSNDLGVSYIASHFMDK